MSHSKNFNNAPENKALSKKELAQIMGISVSTLRRRLKDAGLEIPRGLIYPSKVKEILQALQ